MEQEFDQYRLCCGALLDAECVGDQVVLSCLSCGMIWRRQFDGALAPVPRENGAVGSSPTPL